MLLVLPEWESSLFQGTSSLSVCLSSGKSNSFNTSKSPMPCQEDRTYNELQKPHSDHLLLRNYSNIETSCDPQTSTLKSTAVAHCVSGCEVVQNFQLTAKRMTNRIGRSASAEDDHHTMPRQGCVFSQGSFENAMEYVAFYCCKSS